MENIVLYPSSGFSHLISMVELGKLLSQSSSISSITILLDSPSIASAYTSYISSVSSSFPSVTFMSLPSVPLEPSNYQNLLHMKFSSYQKNNLKVFEALKLISLSSPISAFIIDFFCYTTVEVSQSLRIPTFFYMTFGASGLAFFLNFPVFDKIYSDSYRKLKISLEIPGLFSVPSSHMLEPMLDRGPSYYEFVKMAETFPKSDGIIVNTFESLEVRAVMGLKQGTCLPSTPIPPVYCVGPLIANGGDNGNTHGAERHQCLKWLDLQASRSVVYLAFGSRGVFSKEQLWEIAYGLEKSGVRFLWVVRPPLRYNAFRTPPEDLESILPQGFLDRTKERGYVVKSWAPQVAILSHESVGGFVTHCGWNSILEAVGAGVPMIAWPLYAEQRFNKILLVEEIRIALPLNELENRFVKSSEIKKRVKQILHSEKGNVLRTRVSDLKDKARDALNEGGSYKVNLAALLESWKELRSDAFDGTLKSDV